MSKRRLGTRIKLGWIKEIIEKKCVICHLTENNKQIDVDLSKIYIYEDTDLLFQNKKGQFVEIISEEFIMNKEEDRIQLFLAHEINPYFIGFVKFYDSERGFGKIQSNYEEFFIHHSQLKNGHDIEEYQLLVFETNFSKEKFQAIKCRFLTRKRLSQDKFLFAQIQKIIADNNEYLLEIIESNKDLLSEFIVELTNNNLDIFDKNTIYQLWMEGLYEANNEKILFELLKSNDLFEEYVYKYDGFKRKYLNDEKFKNDIFKILYQNFEEFNIDNDLHFIRNTIFILRKYYPLLLNNVEKYILSHSTDYIKLKLWLEDIFHDFDPIRYKFLFPILNFKDQKLFFKKLFKELKDQDSKIHIQDILSLPVIDYNLSEEVRKLDKKGLDYSICIIIDILNQWIKNKEKTIHSIERSIFSIVESFINQVNEPEHLIEITGFFHECEGRCAIQYFENKNELGEYKISNITYQRYEKIKSSPYYCDGRKMIDSKTNGAILDKKTKLEMWCAQIRLL